MNILYETENGIFEFEREEVLRELKNLVSTSDVAYGEKLIVFIENTSSDLTKIPIECHEFEYIVLQCLDGGSGEVFCKECGKSYSANKLVLYELGDGASPFSKKRGLTEKMRKLFSEKLQISPGFGGKGYKCPRGHILIEKTLWIT